MISDLSGPLAGIEAVMKNKINTYTYYYLYIGAASFIACLIQASCYIFYVLFSKSHLLHFPRFYAGLQPANDKCIK